MKTLDLYLRTTFTEKSISLAELELEKLIIHLCRNLTGKAMFESTDAFLTRGVQGNMYLQKYAYEAKTFSVLIKAAYEIIMPNCPPYLKPLIRPWLTLTGRQCSLQAVRVCARTRLSETGHTHKYTALRHIMLKQCP